MEITFKNVEYYYKKGSKKVLNGINFTIEDGKVTGLIGPSGSGKTTLIEMINGLKKPTKGKILVGSETISRRDKIKDIKKFRLNIGMVFQFPEEQFFCDTVEKEISFALEQFNFSKEDTIEKIKESLKTVELDESFLTRDPFSLSNGEMRKVAIASILAYDPEILILDEPTIGLDMTSKRNLINILTTIKVKYKKTIIIVSHDVDFINKISDNVVLINEGNIISCGNKYDVFKNEKLLNDNEILIPKIIEFENYVLKEKNIKLGYRDDINDLVKDILRHVK